MKCACNKGGRSLSACSKGRKRTPRSLSESSSSSHETSWSLTKTILPAGSGKPRSRAGFASEAVRLAPSFAKASEDKSETAPALAGRENAATPSRFLTEEKRQCSSFRLGYGSGGTFFPASFFGPPNTKE